MMARTEGGVQTSTFLYQQDLTGLRDGHPNRLAAFWVINSLPGVNRTEQNLVPPPSSSFISA